MFGRCLIRPSFYMIILTKDYLSTFTDLVPLNCTFFSTRMPVHRGRLTAVFKDIFHGRITPTEVYDSFELQMSQMEMAADPALFVIIYRLLQ